MQRFLKSQRGYVLVLTLLFMPIFIGIGLLVIDISRASNAQQDHQAAADALALAGARELDGRTDSITRAQARMTEITNTVSFVQLGVDQVIQYSTAGSSAPSDDSQYKTYFTVYFLREIPESDDVKIDIDFINNNRIPLRDYASKGADAKYVLVQSRTTGILSLFFDPLVGGDSNYSVGAVAVATLKRVTCEPTPMFMCNPFSSPSKSSEVSELELKNNIQNGSFYGKMIKLQTRPNNSPVAGNIGYLDIDGKATKTVADELAGIQGNRCYTVEDSVDLKPGGVVPAWDGFNTRFDITSNSYRANTTYPPALNVRKGWKNAECSVGNNYEYNPYPRFLDNARLTNPTTSELQFPFMNGGDWNYKTSTTFRIGKGNSARDLVIPAYNTVLGTDSGPVNPYDPNRNPSRYDVYRYELESANRLNYKAAPTNVAEDANPQCITGGDRALYGGDRRTMLMAVVDCEGSQAGKLSGAAKGIPVQLYARVFLVNPVTGAAESGSETLDIEIVDVSERGTGNLNSLTRPEPLLVR